MESVIPQEHSGAQCAITGGDFVSLKSDAKLPNYGPTMTVLDITESGSVLCQWWTTTNEYRERRFRLELLALVNGRRCEGRPLNQQSQNRA
jgi:uncharacterized protein YodC (DUF2158 family)